VKEITRFQVKITHTYTKEVDAEDKEKATQMVFYMLRDEISHASSFGEILDYLDNMADIEVKIIAETVPSFFYSGNTR
jgi:hypothetical protein